LNVSKHLWKAGEAIASIDFMHLNNHTFWLRGFSL